MIFTTNLSDAFVEVADTLVTDFDVIDFLNTLTEHAVAVSGAAAAGLLLADHNGRLQFMAATDQDVRRVGALPAAEPRRPLPGLPPTAANPSSTPTLPTPGDRWPQFAPRGHRGRLPVRARVPDADARPGHRRLGPVRLRRSHASIRDEVRVVQALADVATIGLLQQRSINNAEGMTEQLQVALNSRIVIEQARGAYAQLNGVSVDEAFRQLRQEARASRRKLTEVCAEVLDTGEQRRPSTPGSDL